MTELWKHFGVCKTRNNETQVSKQNNRNGRNDRNETFETTEKISLFERVGSVQIVPI